jgi:photosystem II stability/assembly factor-like uncharacterized protein
LIHPTKVSEHCCGLAHKLSVVLVLVLCFQAGHAGWVKQKTDSLSWFRDIFFLDLEKGWIAGSDGTMLSTTDSGRTWARSAKFTTDTIDQVYFTSDNVGWLLCERSAYDRAGGAASYLRKTTDGGRTWEQMEFKAAGRNRIKRLIFNRDGAGTAFGESGIFYALQPDGSSWKKSLSSFHFLLLDGAYSDRNLGTIVGAGGTILFTADAGQTWEKASLLGDTAIRLNAVCFAGHNTAWAVGTKGRIFHSNGGRLWRQTDSGTKADLNDVYFTTATDGWAVGDGGTIIRTRDSGKTWADVNSPFTQKLERIIFVDGRGWAVGSGGTLLEYGPDLINSGSERPSILEKRGRGSAYKASSATELSCIYPPHRS